MIVVDCVLYYPCRLSPSTHTLLQIQLHADEGDTMGADDAGASPSRLVAWTQIELFDQHHNLLSGRWKALLRVPPMKNTITVAGLNDIVQVMIFVPFQLFFEMPQTSVLKLADCVVAMTVKSEREEEETMPQIFRKFLT